VWPAFNEWKRAFAERILALGEDPVVVEKEEMRVIFHSSTDSAMFINMGGISPCSLSCGSSMPNEAPDKGFEKGRNGFALPGFLENDIGLWRNSSGT
jgi:hypothetical protein